MNTTDEALHRELAEIWRMSTAMPASIAIIIRRWRSARRFRLPAEHRRISRRAPGSVRRRVISSEGSTAARCGQAHCAASRAAPGRRGLFADVSIATKDCRIIDGHMRLGVAAGDHAAIVWPLLCGVAKAEYDPLLCDEVLGEEAERIGLISLTVEDAKLDAKAVEIAGRLAEGARVRSAGPNTRGTTGRGDGTDLRQLAGVGDGRFWGPRGQGRPCLASRKAAAGLSAFVAALTAHPSPVLNHYGNRRRMAAECPVTSRRRV